MCAWVFFKENNPFLLSVSNWVPPTIHLLPRPTSLGSDQRLPTAAVRKGTRNPLPNHQKPPPLPKKKVKRLNFIQFALKIENKLFEENCFNARVNITFLGVVKALWRCLDKLRRNLGSWVWFFKMMTSTKTGVTIPDGWNVYLVTSDSQIIKEYPRKHTQLRVWKITWIVHSTLQGLKLTVRTWKWMSWNTIVSFWAGLFSGVMLVSGSWKDFLNSVLRQKRILFPQSYTSPELSYTATCSSESIDFHYRDVAAGIVRLYRRKVTFKITWRGPVSVPRKVSYVAYTPCLSQKKEIRFKRFWALPLPCRSGCPSRCSHPKTGSERSWQYHTQNSQLHWNEHRPHSKQRQSTMTVLLRPQKEEDQENQR